MTRIVLWASSTVAALVLLFGYHTSTAGVTTATPPSAFVSGPNPGRTASTSAGSPAASPATQNRSTRSAHRPKRRPTRPSPRRGVPATPTAAPATTVAGDVAQTQWGPVQVQLTVSNGRITRVVVPAYPNGNPRDAEINNYALPILIQETTNAQSARIDMVSGATVTSTGYRQSLQSAIDRAGL